tara:strand:+ start:65 stop:997 length:933 start_codon:yes stop_codon:yes gene_type:complete
MEKPKSKIPHIVISLLVIVLAVISYWFYSYSVAQKEFENLLEIQFQESENLRILKLEEENNLRSELDDIIEQFDNSRDEIDNLNIDLDEKQSEINNLKSEIRDLLNIKHDLKEAKKKIVTLQNISKKYFAQVDSLLGKTEKQREVIDNLTLENKEIINKNEDLNKKNTDLNTRLDIGSILEIFEIEIDKLKYGSHGQERKVIKTKNIQVLRCCFKISANSIAKAENKSVYIQYISPKGKLLQSSSTPEKSIFVYEDTTIQATTYSEFNYQNNEIELCVDWERRDILETGKYKILFFIEGTLVGKSSFKLN